MQAKISKKDRVKGIMRILDKLYPDVPIPLKHKNPYQLLIAVVLSGQSTDVAVNNVTPALFKLASTPEAMARQAVGKIRSIIKPVGLSPAKSKNIKALSANLVREFGGKVPSSFAELESLPGVGHKTASVVMSQAFGFAAFPVDTHIHRLAYRWGLSDGKSVVKTERDLKRLFPEHTWNKLHLQMIYFGRQYCPARGHKASECPVCRKFGRKKL